MALTLLAMVSTKASPRPMAPAGGATSSLFSTAASNSGDLPGVDAVTERGIDDDGDDVVRMFLHEGHHGLVELLEARQRSAFGGDVGAVDDDVSWHTVCQSTTLEPCTTRYPQGPSGRGPTLAPVIRAVLWDFGGVILTSPFDAFAAYERRRPAGRLHPAGERDQPGRQRVGPPGARRGDRDGFDALFGPRPGRWAAVSGAACSTLLAARYGRRWSRRSPVPRGGLRTACLTNNVARSRRTGPWSDPRSPR